jgi:selenocysteine lyase/cysteine desulfurase
MVSADNFLTNRNEVIENLKNGLKKKPDIFFISQVFFDSGLAFTDEELFDLSSNCSADTIMVIDGYHGFAAIPTDLSKLEGRVFYLSGGYKYAQAGEGVGFMVVPKGDWRPAYTGWFAEYTNLTKPAGAKVGYSQDGMAFMGATQDPTGFYRFNAVWDLFKKQSLSVTIIHEFVKNLQIKFLEKLPQKFVKTHELTPIFEAKLPRHGHFLTFESSSEDMAKKTQDELKKHGILIDRRGRRLRFGFGLYQNENDVSMLCERLRNMP